MARKLRLEFGGACYHVVNRGNYRQDIFAGKGAAESFQNCLFEACERFGWRLQAFVIMSNHFHLTLETPEPNLSEGMKWLQGTWAIRFNRFRGLVGRPFQGRYKAWHVEPGHALAQVAHYIHLNPADARLVPVARLREYRWSSLRLLAVKPRPVWFDPSNVLRESGGLADTPAGWRCYLGYLAVLAEEDVKKREERFARLCSGWAIGSAGFKADLQARLACQVDDSDRFSLLGADRSAQLEARGQLWEEKLRAAARAFDVELSRLPAPCSAVEKICLAAVMKRTTSVSNRWLAERLQMGRPTSVSALVRSFRLRGGTRTREFKAALSRFMT